MKTVILLSVAVCSYFASRPLIHAKNPNSPDSQLGISGSVHEEMSRIRRDYDRQRAETLRPVAAQYLARLEELQKNVSAQNRTDESELADAVKSARQAFWQEDQPELRHALLTRTWTWRSDVDDQGVPVTFHDNGSVEHIGLHGTWRITGPSEVTIDSDGDGPYVLRFDSPLRNFEGDRRKIAGTANLSPTETLCSRIWTLRGDTLEFRRNGRLIQHGEGWEGQDWRLSADGKQVTITFTNGNGGTFRFESGTMTHFDGSPFQSTPKH